MQKMDGGEGKGETKSREKQAQKPREVMRA